MKNETKKVIGDIADKRTDEQIMERHLKNKNFDDIKNIRLKDIGVLESDIKLYKGVWNLTHINKDTLVVVALERLAQYMQFGNACRDYYNIINKDLEVYRKQKH